ncbi:MAG: protein-L-isoaspartate O-methyltransferase [Sphingomicrobium sp.]
MPSNSRNDEFALLRAAMVDNQLRPQGITDPLILEAMGSVRREMFVPEAARTLAYSDRSIPLGDGRSMMPPAALGLLLQALEPSPGERALIVEAASGYAAELLRAMGVAVEPGAPFDLILIDGAVDQVPEAIIAQLAMGGRLATAIADHGVTRLVVGGKSSGGFGLRSIGDAAVPLLPGFERRQAFVF